MHDLEKGVLYRHNIQKELLTILDILYFIVYVLSANSYPEIRNRRWIYPLR